jgi:hypothetical protein
MSYRTNDILVLVMLIFIGVGFAVIGLVSRIPGFMEQNWWAPLGIGILIFLVSLINIGFVATEPTKIPCPYCHEKIVPKVKSMSGHLRLSRLDED